MKKGKAYLEKRKDFRYNNLNGLYHQELETEGV